MIDFRLRQLHHFVAIAETGTYREAAERTFTTQPALSVSIRKLETMLNVQLFDRGSRGVTLTAAGEAFLLEARRTLLHAEQARQNARLAAIGEWGIVRLGFVGSAIYNFLPSRLPSFIERYPGVRLELQESTTVSITEMLLDGRLDAGIIRLDEDSTNALDVVNVERDDLVAVVPAAHALAKRKRIELAALQSDPFVMFSQKQVPGLYVAVGDACRSAGFIPRIAQEATQAVTVVGLVGSGLGVALVPGVISKFTNNQVRFIRVTDAACHGRLTLSFATHSENVSPATSRLGEIIATM